MTKLNVNPIAVCHKMKSKDCQGVVPSDPGEWIYWCKDVSRWRNKDCKHSGPKYLLEATDDPSRPKMTKLEE
jgi:hypothetical protein